MGGHVAVEVLNMVDIPLSGHPLGPYGGGHWVGQTPKTFAKTVSKTVVKNVAKTVTITSGKNMYGCGKNAGKNVRGID